DALSTGATQEVDFGEIVRTLVRMVGEALLSDDRPVHIQVEGDGGELRAEVATPLAVVLTELLQNAVRHGYPDYRDLGHRDLGQGDWGDGSLPAHTGGTVLVSLENDGAELLVRVEDDGVGLPDDFSLGGSTLALTI